MTELTELQLYRNFLTGTIPTELGKCSKLIEAQIYTNWFTGSVPTEIGSLTDLTYFSVEDNALTGPIPTEFGLLTSMEELCARPPSTTITHPWGLLYSIITLFFHVWAWASSLGRRMRGELSAERRPGWVQ